ncbi:hypothetical protein GWG65_30395 [Bradyrhizobium sp. CSA207]|uniref:reverse transcriptase domain-containing protein n=1 Tax=Bradyrhizobium sp. CSA207 TaxID=2698826 RepID=UPI0023AF8ECE|nr:reverse transcriptase domain-containing protein [Bradyrhizobium sp. CSA207]MDE5445642.1 hypothetical protein [Bradyrhizobium sp. CSA207]
MVAQIACHEEVLPQGSPCSPIISELLTHCLDIRLATLAKKHRCTYTRYADDLTFYTNQKEFPSALAVETKAGWRNGLVQKIESANFTINPTKTRMQLHARRQDERKIMALKIQVDAYRANFQDFMMQPPSVQATASEFGRLLVEKIDGYLAQISEIVGNAIRLKGGRPNEQDEIEFILAARLRAPARLDKVRAKISFEEDAFDFISATSGKDATNGPLSGSAHGVLQILIEDVSGGNYADACGDKEQNAL